MVSAKFHAIGVGDPWIRRRITEEIHSLGLEGAVLDAGQNTLAVVVDGDKEKILLLKNRITKATPKHIQYTNPEFGAFEAPKTEMKFTQEDLRRLYELLAELEKNTRKINLKLDQLLIQKPSFTQTTEVEADDKPKEDAQDAASGFFSMFDD